MRARYERTGGFTLIELLVVVAIIALLISVLLPALGRAKEAGNKVYCANNLAQFGRACYMYNEEYASFCPHNPYPQYYPSSDMWGGHWMGGWDPATGWLITYGMRMEPPEKYPSGHFRWYMLEEDEIPDVCTCPSAIRENLFMPSVESTPTLPIGNPEMFIWQYAAFFKFAGPCRSATPVINANILPVHGGRNPPIGDPVGASLSVNRWNDNGQWGVPCINIAPKAGAPDDPNAKGANIPTRIQACTPNEIDDPARVYYMADTNDYKPTPGDMVNEGVEAGTNDGWRWGSGTMLDGTVTGTAPDDDNQIYLGTRHSGWANVVYMDGHADSSNQKHLREWNMEYAATGRWNSRKWRSATFEANLDIANIGTQGHLMPIMMIKGWELVLAPK